MRRISSGRGYRGLDAAVAAWLRGFSDCHVVFGRRGVQVTDFDLQHDFVQRGAVWEVRFRERGGPASTLVAGERDHVQRYFVWRLAASAQSSIGRGFQQYPVAPERVAAVGGPLTVRSGSDGLEDVWADGRRVAQFATRSDAVEFTHFGHLPVELLIDQIMGPAEDMIFLAGARYRTDEQQREDAARIQRGAAALMRARR